MTENEHIKKAVGQLASQMAEKSRRAYFQAVRDFEERELRRLVDTTPVYDPMKPVQGAKYARFVEYGVPKK